MDGENITFDLGAANQTQFSKIELESASEADCGIWLIPAKAKGGCCSKRPWNLDLNSAATVLYSALTSPKYARATLNIFESHQKKKIWAGKSKSKELKNTIGELTGTKVTVVEVIHKWERSKA